MSKSDDCEEEERERKKRVCGRDFSGIYTGSYIHTQSFLSRVFGKVEGELVKISEFRHFFYLLFHCTILALLPQLVYTVTPNEGGREGEKKNRERGGERVWRKGGKELVACKLQLTVTNMGITCISAIVLYPSCRIVNS